MRGRRTSAVRFVAAAGVAAAVVGLGTPGPRLWAQKAEAPAQKLDPGDSLPSQEVPPTRIEGAIDAPRPLPPARTEPDLPQANTSAPTRRAMAVAADAALADPEGAARAFVERSQKEADEAITALSKEAETLRARLQKVEAGLARWQSVKESLGANDVAGRASWRGRIVPGTVVTPGLRDDAPIILEPVPPPGDEPARRGRGARTGKPESPVRPALPEVESRPSPKAATPPDVPKGDDVDPTAPQPKGVVHRPSSSPIRVE